MSLGGTLVRKEMKILTKIRYGTIPEYIMTSPEIKIASLTIFYYMKLSKKDLKKSSYEELNSDRLTLCSSKDLRHLRKQ